MVTLTSSASLSAADALDAHALVLMGSQLHAAGQQRLAVYTDPPRLMMS
jgi:hypothetical protein